MNVLKKTLPPGDSFAPPSSYKKAAPGAMPQLDNCAYPPQLASDVDITARHDGAKQSFVAGSAAAGRYLRLGATERQVLELLDGSRTPSAVCEELTRRNGAGPRIDALGRFLTRLDEAGILAGERTAAPRQTNRAGSRFYARWSLFNPEPLFDRLLPLLGWIWTSSFFVASIGLMLVAVLLALAHEAEVSKYATQTLHQHYLAIFLAAWVIGVSHEFAHGLTCRAFGGRATEVGVILIYYCIPGLYCNVSGLHLIPQRGRRMWVIAAGVYWQLLVGSSALLGWLASNPDTLLAQTAMVVASGSLLYVAFNANPLIKLDGYYFLSQWLSIPNLMSRSRAHWRFLLRKILPGEPDPESSRFTSRERRALLTFGFLSYFYNLTLPVAIVWYGARYLTDKFQFAGLLLSLLLGLAYLWKPIKRLFEQEGEDMTNKGLTEGEPKKSRRRLYVPGAITVAFAAAIYLPWTASVGSYGSVTALPGREAIIRAADNASLMMLNVQPGQQLARGASIGRMGNLDLEEQIAQVRTDLARVNADADRLAGELNVQQEAAVTSELQLTQRRRELNDIDAEEQLIRTRLQLDAAPAPTLILTSMTPSSQPFPAALASMEAERSQLQVRLAEADQQLGRARSLFKERILARSDLDAAEAKSAALAFDLSAARGRMNAALVEHNRLQARSQTAVSLAVSNLQTGRAQWSNLNLQLQAMRRLRESIAARLEVLEQKRKQFDLVAPLAGTVFGESLPDAVGQHFPKGGEICRIADTRELLVRILVAEQEVGDIDTAQRVRVKTRAFPDRIFQGAVSRIGGESELDSSGQRSYRVELTIQNEGGLLRPGMTVFARIDFGRHTVAWLALHKLKQTLRPETWML